MHRLFCSPLGHSKLDAFLSCLNNAGAGEDAGKRVLVLPSPFLLDHARTLLRNSGRGVQSMPAIMSMDQLAASLGNLRRFSRIEQELLVEQLVRESGWTEGENPFAAICNMPGFVRSLARLFDEFKFAALTPTELEIALQGLGDESAGLRERDFLLMNLFSRYQQRIRTLVVADIAETYFMACERLRDDSVELPFKQLMIAEFSVLSPLQLEWIRALQRHVDIDIALCYEKNRSGVFAAVEPTVQALIGQGFTVQSPSQRPDHSADLAFFCGNLFDDAKPQPMTGNGLEVIVGADRYLETVRVADRIKQWLVVGKRLPDEVFLLVRQPEDYPWLCKVFEERGIPLDRPQEQSVLVQSVCRLLFAWIDWVEEPFRRSRAMEVLKSPLLRMKLEWDPYQLEQSLLPYVLCTLSDWRAALDRVSVAAAGLSRVPEDWDELEIMLESWRNAHTLGECIALARQWLQWLRIPETLKKCRQRGFLTLGELKGELQATEMIFAALQEEEAISGWVSLEESASAVRQFASLLKKLLSDCRVIVQDRCEGGVRVVSPGAASGIRSPLVVFMGLTEGSFPAQTRENWIFSNSERLQLTGLGVFLSTQAEREALERFNFALGVAMAEETLILSANHESESMTSPYLEEISRLFGDSIQRESFGYSQAILQDPQAATGKSGLLQSAVRNTRPDLPLSAIWQKVIEFYRTELPAGLAERVIVERSRSGVFAGETNVNELAGSAGPHYSASSLERYAACPFSYFVTDILGLQLWEEAQEGMDALTAGALWHEILAEFLKRRQGATLSKDIGLHTRVMMNLLDSAVEDRIQSGKWRPGPFWPFERIRWQQSAEAWLRSEISRQQESPLRPHYFEWAFGMSQKTGHDRSSTPHPLIFDGVTPEVTLQGTVDRIDLDDESFRIIDYKTGAIPSLKSVQQGLCLQLPVYMMAVERLLFEGKKQGVGWYLSLNEKAKKLELPGKSYTYTSLQADVAENIRRTVDGIRRGSFPAQPAQSCPDYCPAASICRFDGEVISEEPEDSTDE